MIYKPCGWFTLFYIKLTVADTILLTDPNIWHFWKSNITIRRFLSRISSTILMANRTASISFINTQSVVLALSSFFKKQGIFFLEYHWRNIDFFFWLQRGNSIQTISPFYEDKVQFNWLGFSSSQVNIIDSVYVHSSHFIIIDWVRVWLC